MKVKLHREVWGLIETASVKREGGKWFVIFTADLGPCQVEPSTNPEIGIDVGLSSFLTTSHCEHCGLVLNRDLNAARNNLARGRQARLEPAGGNVGQRAERPPKGSARSTTVEAPRRNLPRVGPKTPSSLIRLVQLRFWE